MGQFPVVVIFGLTFPPVVLDLLVSLVLFWLVHRLLTRTRLYDVVWHPALFNAALYCCLFYLVSLLVI